MKKTGLFLVAVLLGFSLMACSSGKDGEVQIRYYSDGTTLMAALDAGAVDAGVLPEPAVSNWLKRDEGNMRLFDLQELYGEQSYPQAAMVAKTSFIDSSSDIVAKIIEAMETAENDNWLKDNIAAAITGINSKLAAGVNASMQAAAINQTVIENCNIKTVYASTAKTNINAYMSKLTAISAVAGGSAADAFFADIAAIKGVATVSSGKDVLIVMPDGAPALAMAKLIHENMQFGNSVTYRVVSPGDISNYVAVNNDADVIILPINAAVKLAGSGEKFKLLTVNTHGNLFIAGKQDIKTISGLKGKTVGVIGQGQIPDFTFRMILGDNNIKYRAGN